MKITIDVEGYAEEQFADHIAEKVLARFGETWTERLEAKFESRFDAEIRARFAVIADETIRAAVAEALVSGFRATNGYGEPIGEPESLKARIGKMLTERSGGYHDGGPRIEVIAKEIIEKAAYKELREEFDAARAAFRAKVDGVLAAKLTEALREAVGLKS